MNLQDLPFEILTKIFNYVPDPAKYTVLCKSFYHAICSLPSDGRHATISHHDLLLTSTFLNNIGHYFEETKVKFIKSDEFLIKFGKYIKNVWISVGFFERDYTPIDVNSILQYTLNCIDLDLYLRLDYPAEMLPIEEVKVKLPYLKKLDIPYVRNFKHVIFIEKILNENDLESFTCNFGTQNEELIRQVLKLLSTTSKDIKELELFGTHRILEYGCDLEKINSLNLHIYFNPEEFKGEALEKLKNLKKLTLCITQKIEKFPFLTSSKLKNLEYLGIRCQSGNSLDIFEDLSEPVLKMKVLIINGIRIEDSKHLEKILKVFTNLQELKICQWRCATTEKLNLVQFDWENCHNPDMKILKLDIPQKCNSKLIEILTTTYPNLTSLKVNETQYIEQLLVKNDAEYFKNVINSDNRFRELLVKNFEMGSKIDCLRTTNRKFGKLSIDIGKSDFAPEKFQYLVEIMHRQGKYIKELSLSKDITYEVFWKLISSATNCKKMVFFRVNVLDIEDHKDDESAMRSIVPGQVEEIYLRPEHDKSFNFIQILNNFFNLQPNLKKLTLKNDSIKNIEPEYFENFLSNCNLEYFEWYMHETYIYDEQYLDVSRTEQQNVVTSIICRQKKLKSLKILFIMWDELFEEITNNCKELEEFEFYGAEELMPETFYDIQNLKNLKNLSFGHSETADYEVELFFTQLSSFLIGIRSLSLASLSIFRIKEPSPEVIIELAALVQSLKLLTIEIIEGDNYSHHPCSILQHFIYLQGLSIDMHCNRSTLQHVYNLENNPNLKSFCVSSDKVIITVNDIKNILKACPNLEYLYIDAFIHDSHEPEYFENLEKVTLDELYRILEAGKKLRSIYISEVKISDPENIEDCQLKRRFNAFEYSQEKFDWCYPHRESEIMLSLDKASVEKMKKKTICGEVLWKKRTLEH